MVGSIASGGCDVLLCCVVLCCVALRCVALCCVALRCVALCCVARTHFTSHLHRANMITVYVRLVVWR